MVEIHPGEGPPWLGIFAFGRLTARGVSGIFTTPDPQCLSVVAKGAGYLVRADDPSVWSLVQANPIIDVRPIPTWGILVFAEHTRLIAYGESGVKWRTKRLTWDDLMIAEVTDEFIRGEFWDVISKSTGEFRVSLATGEHEGGISEHQSGCEG